MARSIRKRCTHCNARTGHRHDVAPTSAIAANLRTWEVVEDGTEERGYAWACNNCNRLSPRQHRRTKAQMALARVRASGALQNQTTDLPLHARNELARISGLSGVEVVRRSSALSMTYYLREVPCGFSRLTTPRNDCECIGVYEYTRQETGGRHVFRACPPCAAKALRVSW